MAHIEMDNELPGIAGLLKQFPDTAKPLTELAQLLLRTESGLTPGERETIAAFVSSRNECSYCANSHGATARHLLGEKESIVDQVLADPEQAKISAKLKALLAVAGRVQESGRAVAPADIEHAKSSGATDRDIHDTVLIAAAFCMFNRYVDGLGTWAPRDAVDYEESAKVLATQGYIRER